MGNNNERKQYSLQHKRKHSNNKEAYMDRLKSTGRKIDVFTDITKRGALPKEASMHTAEKTAIKIEMREIEKKGGDEMIKYTDSLNSKNIENNRENHTILN